MSATREAYARGYAERGGFECSVGIEWRDGDDIDGLSRIAHEIADYSAEWGRHDLATTSAEDKITAHWPGRAYFIETERDGQGVQVYQPFGMPRNA